MRKCKVVCGSTVVGGCFTLPSGTISVSSAGRVGGFSALGAIIRSVAGRGSSLKVRKIFNSASFTPNRS